MQLFFEIPDFVVLCCGFCSFAIFIKFHVYRPMYVRIVESFIGLDLRTKAFGSKKESNSIKV